MTEEMVLQRPIFEALCRYLHWHDLLTLICVNKKVNDTYKNDILVWRKICNGDVQIVCKLGRLDVLKDICKDGTNRINLRQKDAICLAGAYGHLEMVKWMHENIFVRSFDIWVNEYTDLIFYTPVFKLFGTTKNLKNRCITHSNLIK